MDDDAQALQGLLELMLGLGALGGALGDSSDTSPNFDNSDHDLDCEDLDFDPQISPFADQFLDRIDIDVEAIALQSNTSNKLECDSQTSDLAINSSPDIQANNSNPEGAIASLQSLLFGSDLQIIKGNVQQLEQKIQNIEHQIYEPQELIHLLLPVISDILELKVSQASSEITRAIAPVIDQMITVNIGQGQIQMSEALAPVMSTAITQNINRSPGEFANAIAPEMGTAIQEQLRINKGAMIDALYPIIGNTISKYFAEAIKAINIKVEQTLSKEGILRKIKAKLQGVSEAELIMRESMPVNIRAIFLIHKASGLIISEVQNPNTLEILESDMVAGMLTAIRSFVNDCIMQSGFNAELNEIDYGGSKILLEAAGYAYLAVVVDGVTTVPLVNKIRHTLEAIVAAHSKEIASFDGDLDAVPTDIKPALEQLFINTSDQPKPSNPKTLIILVAALIGAIAIPWSLISYQQQKQQAQLDAIKAQVTQTLTATPELSVYGLIATITKNQDQTKIQLQGRVPNTQLKNLAAKVTLNALKSANPDTNSNPVAIDNQILPVNIPPDPAAIKAEIQRLTAVLNRLNGIEITTAYDLETNQLAIAGSVANPSQSKIVSSAFAQIPQITAITSTIQIQIPQILTRIYFDFNSAQVLESEMPKILQIKSQLEQFPNYQLTIIGHSDRQGNFETNSLIAVRRAETVKGILVQLGVPEAKIETLGSVEADQTSPQLSRYVEFKLS